MKKLILGLLFIAATSIATAQQLYVEGGKTVSTWDYKNSQGSRLENIQATSQSFMGIGYKNQLFTKNLNLAVGFNYSGYGAIGSDDTIGNFMEWDVNYAGLNLELDYKLFSIKKANFYTKVGMSASFFIHGSQTLNKRVINLKNDEDFDTTMFTTQVGAGFSHPISEKLSFYAQYMYGKSLDKASGPAELKIRTDNVGFGLLIDISSY